MFRFLKFYIGNKNEAFHECRLKDGVNIIYSNDNNKGKTIVLQGLYYALGNTPIFPSTFDYKNYYFIIDCEKDNHIFSICRKDKTFLVRNKKSLNIFNNVSEFKRFFNDNIYKLPQIIKNDRDVLADLELFFQLFFVGQDKRDTSRIFNTGYNNKDDFMNMLYAYTGCSEIISEIDVDEIKKKQQELKEERSSILKKAKFLTKPSVSSKLSTYTVDREMYVKKMQEVEKINEKLIALKNERNRIQNRKLKNESLITELNSLKRSLSEGKLICLDCHSEHIGYQNANKDVTFDVSDDDIRSDILSVIQTRIDIADEELERINNDIFNVQKKLKDLLKDEDISVENWILYKDNIQSSQSIDERIHQIDCELDKYNNLLKKDKKDQSLNIEARNTLRHSLLTEMNSFYKMLEPTGNHIFDALFSKKDVNYSGSEECEFYLARLYALAKILHHTFPIVMDAFREGELSTKKEEMIIDYFSKLSNQVVFSATLKDQELNKYNQFSNINAIDYSKNKTHHVLNNEDVPILLDKLSEFSIIL